MEYFSPHAAFPYSKEIHSLPKSSIPNLELENQRQSLYLALRSIRTDVIGKKLKNSGYLVFDRFITDVLGATTIRVSQWYPPETPEKLTKFIDELEELDIDRVGIDAIIYYILKDFSRKDAERFVCGGDDLQSVDHTRISLRIPQCLYDLINAIYYIDRFDIFRSLKHLNANDYSTLPMSFMSYFIKIANIVPYHAEVQLSDVSDFHDMRAFIDSRSCKPSACSVVSAVRAFNAPVLYLDADTQLLFIDSLSDLNAHSAVMFNEELCANYDVQPVITQTMILRLTVTKLLLKTVKQQKALKALDEAGKLSGMVFDELFQRLAMFSLVDTKVDERVTDVLYEILYSEQSDEEKKLREKFPNYFSRLDEFKVAVRKTARDLLAWKCALENKPHRLAEIALVNVGKESSNGSTLKEVAAHFY